MKSWKQRRSSRGTLHDDDDDDDDDENSYTQTVSNQSVKQQNS